MPTYDLLIGLNSSRFIDVDVFEMAKIPDNVELTGVTFRYVPANPGEGITTNAYLARLQVSAANQWQAKRRAICRVERVLSVMGAYNIPLHIEYHAISIQPVHEDNSTSVTTSVVDDQEEVDDPYEMPAALGWIRFDVEFERRALSWCDRWPEWLRIALDLNRLAIVSHMRSAFVIRYSILELMEKEIVGPPKAIVSQRLDKGQRKQLRKQLDAALAEHHLDKGSRERLAERLFATEERSRAVRFAALLKTFEIDADMDHDIQPIILMRNRIAHPGYSIAGKDFLQSAERLRYWVQTGLRIHLEPPY